MPGDLSQRIADLSWEKRALFESQFINNNGTATTDGGILRREFAERYPLSFAQNRMWFLEQLEPGRPTYNVFEAFRLLGPLNVVALESAFSEIVARHEILRTTFISVEGQARQVVNEPRPLSLPIEDLRFLTRSAKKQEIERLVTRQAGRTFDLAEGPLFTPSLLRIDEEEHFLLLSVHHLVFDGWSRDILFKELGALYEACRASKPSPLPELGIQYGDFAAWQHRWVQDKVLVRELPYWKRQLEGNLPALQLPTDHPRPSVHTLRGAHESLLLSRQLSEGLKRLSRSRSVTLFMTLLAAFKLLLYRYTGQTDILVGSPIAGRNRVETEKLIGLFINTLAFRTDLSGNPSFHNLLTRVREVALGAYAHQNLPFEKLVEELHPDRDLSRTPLFQVFFNLLPLVDNKVNLPGLRVSSLSLGRIVSKFDLTLYAQDRAEAICFDLAYNADLFDSSTIKQMLARFETLLEGIVADPEQRISKLRVLPEAQRHQAGNLVRPTEPFVEFSQVEIEQSITRRFEQKVKECPHKMAVKDQSVEWSYVKLDHAANRIAQAVLTLCGEGQETVALVFEHGAPMLAALLGALKSGKTYVPLDPSYPKEHLAYVVKDSKASAILTNERHLELARSLSNRAVKLVNIDDLTGSRQNVFRPVFPDTLAYIIYTSGSTGQPKGVVQNHRNVLFHIQNYTNSLHIHSGDRLTLLSSYSFDAAVMDIFGALLNGAALYPLDIRQEGLGSLPKWIAGCEITIYHSTPTIFRQFANTLKKGETFPRVRMVVLGGEEVYKKDVEIYKKHFSEECLFVNGLGPTESTVTLQYFMNKQTPVVRNTVPVGYPVGSTKILLLNEFGEDNEIYGEIAVRSPYIALGYWEHPELTKAAFLPEKDGKDRRIYKTGDWGQLLSDGSIEFLGRNDLRVKIRGYRVELGEIEAVLGQHQALKEVVVATSEEAPGERQLVAYVVPYHNVNPSVTELRAFLKEKLPEYMVPSSFVLLDSIPLTPGGKVDRKALRAPASVHPVLHKAFVPPRDMLEIHLIKIWERILAIQPIGLRDNFFDLGGHSLLAVRLFAEIEKSFGKKLPLAILFQAPTIEQLTVVLRENEWLPIWSSLVAIQPRGRKPPFFCVHAAGGNVLFYRDLARHFGEDQPVYGLQAAGMDGKRPLHESVEEMAAHYIEEIRTIEPDGPYYLGGGSFGGTVAFEMAQQLSGQGQEVALLALFDTNGPGYPRYLPTTTLFRRYVYRFSRRLEHHIGSLLLLEPRARLKYLLEKSGKAKQEFKRVFRRKQEKILRKIYRAFGQPLPHNLRGARKSIRQACRCYVPRPYAGRVTLFRASKQPLGIYVDPSLGWDRVSTGGLEIHEVPGSHGAIVAEPRVRFLAEKLRACLEAAQARGVRKQTA